MSNSLRDQLLGLGYKPAPKPESAPVERKAQVPNDRRPPQGKPSDRRPPQGKPADRRPSRTREEIDLAKAYALRAQKEKDDRIEAERLKQEEAKVRREAKGKLAELLKEKSLNDPAALAKFPVWWQDQARLRQCRTIEGIECG